MVAGTRKSDATVEEGIGWEKRTNHVRGDIVAVLSTTAEERRVAYWLRYFGIS